MEEDKDIIPGNEDLDVVRDEIGNIKDLIYTVRGKQVMLDSDVARLYKYETRRINEAVRRNKERFPENFCFQLTDYEMLNLRSQFVTSKKRSMSENIIDDSLRSQIATLKKSGRGQHRKYLLYVFTEQGIAMLSGLLKNEIAVKVSINIMNAFVEMRKFIVNNGQIFQEIYTINRKLLEYDKKFDEVFDELQKTKSRNLSKRYFLMDKYMMHIG